MLDDNKQDVATENITPTKQDEIILDPKHISSFIKGKRLGAFDYGKRRTGFAVCDEFHITVTTKGIFETDSPTFFDSICTAIERERIGLIVVGIPERLDGEVTKVIKQIRSFIKALRKRVSIPIVEQDEAFTSKRAVRTMLDIGVKKKDRRNKSRTDEISAAIILRDFMQEYE